MVWKKYMLYLFVPLVKKWKNNNYFQFSIMPKEGYFNTHGVHENHASTSSAGEF